MTPTYWQRPKRIFLTIAQIVPIGAQDHSEHKVHMKQAYTKYINILELRALKRALLSILRPFQFFALS